MTTAIVLAGGLGKRLRGVISDVPKPMAIVENRPFVAYLLDFLEENFQNLSNHSKLKLDFLILTPFCPKLTLTTLPFGFFT